jgi:Arc/MetJ family transcription regulator
MRTTLDLPAELIEQARAAVGFKSKTDTVIFALRELIRRQRLEELKVLMRSITFEFDPVEVRRKDRRRVQGHRP